jgi:hypothetical protein
MPGMPSSLAGSFSQCSKLPRAAEVSHPSFRHEFTEQGTLGETVATPEEPAATKGYNPLPGEKIRVRKPRQHQSPNKGKRKEKGIGRGGGGMKGGLQMFSGWTHHL